MMHKKIRNKDYYIFNIDRNMRGGGILMLTLCKHLCVFEKRKNKCFNI